MPIQAIPEHTIAALAKDVIAGDYRKFIRLGAATLAGLFGGRIAEAVVEGILDKVWKKADQEKARAAAQAAQAAEQARIVAALRDALRTELVAIVDKLDALRDGQLGTHRALEALADRAAASAHDLAQIREQVAALTDAAAAQAPAAAQELLVHLATASHRVPPYCDGAEIVFTVHNFTSHTLKLHTLALTLVARSEIDELQLPRPGEPIANVELHASLVGRESGVVDLLDGVDAQFVLRPDDADGFRLQLACDDGYHYELALECVADDIRAQTQWRSAPVQFVVTAPISRPETLRARKRG